MFELLPTFNKSEKSPTEIQPREMALLQTGNFNSEQEVKEYLQQLDEGFNQFNEGENKIEDFQNKFEKIIKEAESQIKEIESLSPGRVVDRRELFKSVLSGIAQNYQELEPVLSGIERERGFSLVEIPKKIGRYVRDNKVAFMCFGALALISRVGFGAGEAEAGEISHHTGGIDGDRAEKIFENIFGRDISHEQAEQIAAAYQFANEEQLQQIIKLGNKTMSKGGFDTQRIVNFLTDPEYVNNANQLFEITQGQSYVKTADSKINESKINGQAKNNLDIDEKWQKEKSKIENLWQNTIKSHQNEQAKFQADAEHDIGEIISTEEIKFPSGKVTIIYGKSGEALKLESRGSASEASSLLNKSATGKIDIRLTSEGEKAYKGRFVTEAQEQMMLKHTATVLANERYSYFQALEQAKKLGNQKASEIIQHKLDEQKQQCEKLYGSIFKK